jgi:hypothetical protein
MSKDITKAYVSEVENNGLGMMTLTAAGCTETRRYLHSSTSLRFLAGYPPACRRSEICS